MEQALYRKYRSRSFDDVVGQDHITNTLKRALKAGRISHAYLFTGPRGVGKTSVARILAHEVNNLSYVDESVHLDIIEIDAASNRRIDEIRDLRDKVHTSPISVKYKVYIIDEVHMLTREAFNALLKTLEEPPAHCIFILATTEAHKLPDTIISRTQRFEFKPISGTGASDYLANIAKKEKININKTALDLLVEHGRGSFRDSVGLLDQLSSYGGKIDDTVVREFLGLPPANLIDSLANAIENGDPAATLAGLEDLTSQGFSVNTVSSLLATNLRQKFLEDFSKIWISKLLKLLIASAASPRPDEQLEIILLQSALGNQSLATASHQPKPKILPTTTTLKSVQASQIPSIVPPNQSKLTNSSPKSAVRSLDESTWNEIIQKSKAQDASIYTALRLATPHLDKNTLTLAFKFGLHQKKIDQARPRELISQLASEIIGRKILVKATFDESQPEKVEKVTVVAKDSASAINTISNIFGKTEVLES